MAAFPTYFKSSNHDSGRRHGSGGLDCTVSGSAGCGVPVDYGLLEIDENDNSFPWGLIHHNELAQMLNNGLGKVSLYDVSSLSFVMSFSCLNVIV